VYDVLMIDPPWPVTKRPSIANGKHTAEALDYPTLSVEDCFALLDQEVLPLAAPRHTVFLWTTEKYLEEAELGMRQRGYKRHVRFIWDKGNGPPPVGMTVRFSHEYLVWYFKPSMTPVYKESIGIFPTVIRENRRQHSRKPDIAYYMVDALYPDARKIDVFSREARPGWDQWGNEPNRNVHQLNFAPLEGAIYPR
jgi:N6-adenosine-specific RNA methylase IME4